MKNIDESKIIKKTTNSIKPVELVNKEQEQIINKSELIDNSKKVKPENDVNIKLDNVQKKEKSIKNEPVAKSPTEKSNIELDPIVKVKLEKNIKPELEPKIEKLDKKSELINKQIIEPKIKEKKESMPIFNGEIKNGKVEITSQRKPINNFNYKRPNINTNSISLEQLRIAKTNTLKAINDIKIDISILTSLMAQNDEYYEFYNNKLTYLKNELNYLNQKKLYIERMLRK